MKIYHPQHGTRNIPSVDFTQLWRDRGWRDTPGAARMAELVSNALDAPQSDDLQTQEEAPQAPVTGTPDTTPPALRLINGVDVVRELQAIPTIGAKAAAAILKARPEGGYPDLAAVAAAVPHVFEPPFAGDLDAIAAWGQ